MWQVDVSHKSEMAGPFSRGDTIIKKHFTLLFMINDSYVHFCYNSKHIPNLLMQC